MYGVVGSVEIEAGRGDDAVAMLKEVMAPQVKALPGFVSGTWGRSPDGTQGRSLIVFDSEENARAAAEGFGQNAPPEAPVNFLSAEVVEIVHQL